MMGIPLSQKHCDDCRFFDAENSEESPLCVAPREMFDSVSVFSARHGAPTCLSQRTSNDAEACGPAGKLFHPMER